MGIKRDILMVLLGLCLAACAGATFPYKYYGIDVSDSVLHGPTAKDDVSFSECLPTATDQSPCTGMMSDIFLAMKQDYLDKSNQLIECQKQLAIK